MSRDTLGLLAAAILGLQSAACGGGTAGPAANQLRNPVIVTDFPDPMVLRVAGLYYAYATTDGTRRIQVARSRDLASWTLLADALPRLPAWQSVEVGKTWAPDVSRIGERYVMYYTGRSRELGVQCVSVAVADRPEGPFMDTSAGPLVCSRELGGAIDPSRFVDADGSTYLLYKSDGNCCGLPAELWGARLAADGLSLASVPQRLGVRNDQPWEGRVVEAPFLVRHGSRYYLFYSANDYASSRYAVGYATGGQVLGPFAKAAENPILRSGRDDAGPGGESVFEGPGGLWMAFHAWTPGRIGPGDPRSMWVVRLRFDHERPVLDR